VGIAATAVAAQPTAIQMNPLRRMMNVPNRSAVRCELAISETAGDRDRRAPARQPGRRGRQRSQEARANVCRYRFRELVWGMVRLPQRLGKRGLSQEQREIEAVAYAQLVVDGHLMIAYRVRADAQPVSDLAGFEPVPQVNHDLTFPLRQRGEPDFLGMGILLLVCV